MKDSQQRVVILSIACLWLGLVAWAYLINAPVSAENEYFPYPVQFMPVVVDLPLPTPVPPTLHVGREMRWEGKGTINEGNKYWYPGTHDLRVVDQQIDNDSVRIHNRVWYDPNPFNWEPTDWYCHYNTTTNRVEVCSSTSSDPAWKWGYPWIFPTDIAVVNGGTVKIDGQVFDVTGPHTILTSFGELAYYWKMVNQKRFLYWDNGGEWQQYVEKGDAILFYESRDSGIRIYDYVQRTYYRNGDRTNDRVRYESNLTQFSGLINIVRELRGENEADAFPAVAGDAAELADTIERLGIDPASLRRGQ